MPRIDVPFSSLEEWLPQCSKQARRCPEHLLYALTKQEGVLLLLGPEGPGLHRDLKERCDLPGCPGSSYTILYYDLI